MWPACKTDLLTCSTRAALVGGMTVYGHCLKASQGATKYSVSEEFVGFQLQSMGVSCFFKLQQKRYHSLWIKEKQKQPWSRT